MENVREVEIAVLCARQMQESNKSYRILTGYDAQRHAIEVALKNANLKWEDIVFNVDSFQGKRGARYGFCSLLVFCLEAARYITPMSP
jgi:hypothetical protein